MTFSTISKCKTNLWGQNSYALAYSAMRIMCGRGLLHEEWRLLGD
jgi:hypothetical protein